LGEGGDKLKAEYLQNNIMKAKSMPDPLLKIHFATTHCQGKYFGGGFYIWKLALTFDRGMIK
jgi:hypothetical protein